MHPDVLQCFHGVIGDQVQHRASQTHTITSHIHENAHHDAVQVPHGHTPFPDPAHKVIFKAALQDIQMRGLTPAGYGLQLEEWDEDGYPMSELVKFGCKREILVELPQSIWLQRAIAWGQGLHVMETIRLGFSEL